MSGDNEYAWERAYERKWEEVQEDESGLLSTALYGEGSSAVGSRRSELKTKKVQRGMMRNVFLILDGSRGMDATDLKPTRAAVVAKVAAEFVREFFDQNPISQLGVILMHNAIAEKITELSGNPKQHVHAISEALKRAGNSNSISQGNEQFGGDMSFQNALDAACRSLALQPNFASREVILIHGALATRDPGNLNESIESLKREKIRASVVSLPGEVYAAQRIAKESGGVYGVPEGFDALRNMLMQHCQPPTVHNDVASGENSQSKEMVMVGFPELVEEQAGLCSCHKALSPRAFVCPQCRTRCCEIPGQCAVCRLYLVSSPAIARSYHHLFPIPDFVSTETVDAVLNVEENVNSNKNGSGMSLEEPHQSNQTICSACLGPIQEKGRKKCPLCSLIVCIDCEVFLHETVHNCPGCT
jgi:transcription initiation factor TFIIH subunit 2